MPAYNAAYYNDEQYNLTADLLSLSDTVTPTDADVTKSVTSLRQDSMTEVDTLGHNVGPDELMDMIACMDVRTMSAVFVREDTMSFADAVLNTFLQDILAETITLTDALISLQDLFMVESVFVDESAFRAEITNKALSDTIRLADWFSVERNPQSSDWSD